MERDLSRIEKYHQVPLSRRFDSIPIAAFRSFATVIEAGGFSAAARLIGVSVSTVSKHIDTLEARLRTTLVMRTTRRMTVTDAGKEFYEQCRSVLDQLDAVTDARLASGGIRGELCLIAPPSFSRCVLAPALPRFLAQHPDLRVEVRVSPAPVDFLKDGVDLAIRMTAAHSRSDRVEWIGPAPSLLCASRDYLERHGTPSCPEDLKKHRCFGGLNSPYPDHWAFKRDNKSSSVFVDPVFSSDMGDVLLGACLAGLGIAGFYLYHVREEIADGRLIPILTDYQADVSAIHAVIPHASYTPVKTIAFLDFLRDVTAD